MTPGPRYRSLVYLTLLVSFLVVVWGGVVRVSGSGLGCPDWPLCHGQFLPGLDTATQIEWFHRFLGIAGGLTLASLVAVTLARYRSDRRLVTMVVAAGALYVLQAVLGGIVVLLELPDTWVTAHLANAELVLAVLTVLAVGMRWPRTFNARERGAPWTALLLAAAVGTYVLLLSGAYVRGAGASTACTTWPLCDDGSFPIFGAAAIHMAHRFVAAVVGVIVMIACYLGWKHRREAEGLGPLAIATAVVFVAQVLIGAANPLTGFSPWALGAHPAAASLLWCCIVAMTGRRMASVGAVSRDGQRPDRAHQAADHVASAAHRARRDVPREPRHSVVRPARRDAHRRRGGIRRRVGAQPLLRPRHRRPHATDEAPPAARGASPRRVGIGMGVALNIVAFAVLALFANIVAALLAIFGTLFYIFVYTLWLKRTTVQNIVIGGAAGAIRRSSAGPRSRARSTSQRGCCSPSSSSGRPRTSGRSRCSSATTTPAPACRCCRWSAAKKRQRGGSSRTRSACVPLSMLLFLGGGLSSVSRCGHRARPDLRRAVGCGLSAPPRRAAVRSRAASTCIRCCTWRFSSS